MVLKRAITIMGEREREKSRDLSDKVTSQVVCSETFDDVLVLFILKSIIRPIAFLDFFLLRLFFNQSKEDNKASALTAFLQDVFYCQPKQP